MHMIMYDHYNIKHTANGTVQQFQCPKDGVDDNFQAQSSELGSGLKYTRCSLREFLWLEESAEVSKLDGTADSPSV